MSLLLPFTLATILTTDPLGYECVPEDRLEIAFALGGKGMRAPQTCIPDPCEQTLTEATLAQYSGYQDATLYGDYRRRMSSVCGTPTAWQEKGIEDEDLLWAVFDGGSEAIPLQDPVAWDVPQADPSDRFKSFPRDTTRRSPPGRFGGFGGGGGGGTKKPSLPSISEIIPPPVDPFRPVPPAPRPPKPTPEPEPEVPSQVPLPAPLFLLAAAAGALALLKRRWRGARAGDAPAAKA
jgi:hypothetical protein